jgi:hypothetical protein
MQDKNTKNQHNNEANTPIEKGFSLLRTDTIQLWLWLDEFPPLSEQLLKSLSQDVSYRIRETTDVIFLLIV